jgi:hypothetical protein
MIKKTRISLITLISLLALGIFALSALAQTPVTAEVDRNYLSTDESLLLTVAIDTSIGDAARPSLPPLDDFQLLGSSSGTQISLINGDMQVQQTYNYSLRPLVPGSLTIGPVEVQINGQTYATEPIALEVVQGTGQIQPQPNQGLPVFPSLPNMPALPNFPNMPGFPTIPGGPGGSGGQGQPAQPLDPADAPPELTGQSFFIEAEVDNNNPYQGQQVLYTFRFYQADSLFDSPDYQAPPFTGFWSEELSDQQTNYTLAAAGNTYRVTELQTVLFPTVAGELTIDPAALFIPGDFFTAEQTLTTQPIQMNVRPLPPDAPPSFQGAIGQFEISASTDKTAAAVDDTVTMTVVVSGAGNLPTMPDPKWTEGPEWRAFDSQAIVNTQVKDGRMQGTRTYERLLVPTQAGELPLPPIEFTYFDPQTESYVTTATEPLTVSVTGSVGANAPLDPGTAVPQGAAAMPGDPALRPIKVSAELGRSSSSPLTDKAGYWLLWAVPLLLIVGQMGWSRYQQQRFDTADSRRSREAAAKAHKALGQAQKQGGDEAAAGPILLRYLEEKLNQRVAGLSQTQLADLLAAQGADPALVARTQECLRRSDMGRFAPAGLAAGQGDLWDETAVVIDALDKALPGQ